MSITETLTWCAFIVIYAPFVSFSNVCISQGDVATHGVVEFFYTCLLEICLLYTSDAADE